MFCFVTSAERRKGTIKKERKITRLAVAINKIASYLFITLRKGYINVNSYHLNSKVHNKIVNDKHNYFCTSWKN